MPDVYRRPYVPVRNLHGDVALRPLLPLTLAHRGRTIVATGLLDTGTDVNVLPYADVCFFRSRGTFEVHPKGTDLLGSA